MTSKPWHKFYDYNVPTSIRYPRFPLQNLVHLAASQFPHKTAIDFYGAQMTFVELRSEMLRLANAFTALGVKKGDRIGIALPNCPQYVIAYHAALSAGATVVNMNPLYTYDELKFMIENTTMETLVTFDAVLPTMKKLAKDLGVKRLIVTRVADYMAGQRKSDTRDLDLDEESYYFSKLIDESKDTKLPRISFETENDVAMIQFTGGTTGVPKGAMLTHANVVSSIFQTSNWFNAVMTYTPFEKRTTLIPIPQFHVFGNMCVNWALLNGATQILVPRFDLQECIDIIRKHEQITFLPCVPTMMTAIVNHPQAEELGLAEHIRYINTGGAPMPTELIARVKDLGINFGEGWGMSETSSVGIGNPLLLNKAGAIGVPIMDVDLRLVNIENGVEDVKPGEPGEMIIKGPAVMKGYWQNPEETKNQLVDGWLHTGDIARADEDGYLYIVDRKKDMVIAGGFNIYPREIDEVLYQHPQVSEAMAVGVPDAYRGETIKAFIVLQPGAKISERDIVDFCKQKLAAYKVPKLVEFRESLPKSAVGKLLRKILREEEIAKTAAGQKAMAQN